MQISRVVVGPIQTNCYLVEDGNEVVVFDPGEQCPDILEALGGKTSKEIVITHRHWDHISAVAELQAATGAPTAAHKLECEAILFPEKGRGADKPIDRPLEEGDDVVVGNCVFKVILTPGHTEGSCCFYCADEKVLIAGDTLFAGGSYGRTDFATGSMESMLQTLRTKFVDIPDDVAILPGHGPISQFATERNLNPYLK